MVRSDRTSQLDESRPNEGLPRSQPRNNTVPVSAPSGPEPRSKLRYGIVALLTLGLILTLGWVILLGWLGARLVTGLLS
jgi:hypothetical protein